MRIIPTDSGERNQVSGLSTLSWGDIGAPLLPTSLRTRWADEPLPVWVAKELGLPAGSRVGALADADLPVTGITDRVRNYFAFLLNSRLESVRPVIAIDQPWPLQLSTDQVPWRRRTRNAVLKSDIADSLSDLPGISFAQLFDVPGMGALSVLDFACTLEAVLDSLNSQHAIDGVDERAAKISAVLTDVLGEPWCDFVSERDPRFADLMPSGKGTLTERIDDLTSNPEATIAGLEALANAVVSIRYRIRELERQPLEDCLRDYVAALANVHDGRLRALVARFHLDGSSMSRTQEEAGVLAGGISRQRIQQLESKAERRRPAHPVVMTALDKGIETLLRAVPLDVQAAAQLLQAEGITRGPFHPSSLIAAAEFAGRAKVLEIRRVYDGELVVALSLESEMIDRMIWIARRQASQAGASSISQIADAMARDGSELAEERIAELMQLFGKAEPLGTEWFCFPLSPNDSVRSISRKMLSVTTPLSVATLRDGIKRAFRFRRSSTRNGAMLPAAPPREILSGYYKAHPHFAIGDDGLVRSVTPLDYRAELGPIEQVMVIVLRAAPSRILDRNGFADACAERGVNLNTLWTLATYSPVIEHLGVGLWTLCGTVADPAVVEAFRKANALRPREQRIADYGWAPTGELWIATRLPRYLESFVFKVPAAIGRFLADRDFSATDLSGGECGVIRIYENLMAGGTPPFLRRAGADEGDILLVRFDLGAGKAALSIIDDDALDELSPES